MSYALITGASRGIGQCIAKELAAKKMDLLLVARNEERLKETADLLSKEHGIRTAYLSIDLAKQNAPQEVHDWCARNNYEVSILVNNAGYGLSGQFDKYSAQEHADMMQVNMTALVQITSLFLPDLKKQSKAYILNIASSAAYQAVPYLSLYAATKSFVLRFSRGLRYELKGSGVSVTCICPGPTDTDFPQRANVGEKAEKAAQKFNMTPEAVASLAVKKMFALKTESITGALNKLSAFMAWLLPKRLTEKVAASLYE